MFRSMTIIRGLALSLTKVIFMLKHSIKLHCYVLCGGVAACPGIACVLCAVQNETLTLSESLTQQTQHINAVTPKQAKKFMKPCITKVYYTNWLTKHSVQHIDWRVNRYPTTHKIPILYDMKWFMTVIKKAHHCTLSWNSLTQFNPHNVPTNPIYYSLCLSMLSLPSGLQKKNKLFIKCSQVHSPFQEMFLPYHGQKHLIRQHTRALVPEI
jgi:hypothetical protein